MMIPASLAGLKRDGDMQLDTGIPKTVIDGSSPSVGNDAFANRLLIIDFKHRRTAVANDRSELGGDFAQASWVPMRADAPGYIVISVMFGGKKLENVMYDSGSSLSGISLRHDEWVAATRPLSHTDASQGHYYQGDAWGEPISVECAPSRKELAIGKARYYGVKACTVFSGDESHMIANGLDATLGNQAFDLTGTIIIDYKDHLFGVLQQ